LHVFDDFIFQNEEAYSVAVFFYCCLAVGRYVMDHVNFCRQPHYIM